MGLARFLDDFNRSVWRLIGPSQEDKAAGFELAVSTRDFARRTQEVVDDKLSFSATLLRAGEVEAANRLLAEVESEVLQEEVALLEKIAEVSVAGSNERKPATRLRLARALAVAMLGSTLLASSAVGMAVVGLFRDDKPAQIGNPPESVGGRTFVADGRTVGFRHMKLNVAGVDMKLTPSEMRRYRELTSGGVSDADELESFLLGVLPTPLAEKVHSALVTVKQQLPQPIKEELNAAATVVNKERKKADEQKPSPEKSSSPQEDDDSPDPSPSGSDDGEKKDDEDGDSQDLPIVGDDDGGI